jgi:uncharacterized membrane protein
LTQTARTLAIGFGVALAACSIPSVGLWSPHGRANTGLFQLYGDKVAHGEVPYRSGFSLEYPPGAIPPLAVPSLPRSHYIPWFHAFEFGCLLISVAAVALALEGVAERRRLAAVAVVGAAPAVLGQLSLNSFDLWPAALAALAVAAVMRGRPPLGFALLGAATAAKLFPALLAPSLLTYVYRRRGWEEAKRALLAGVSTVAVIFAPFAVLGPGGLKFSLQEQAARGLQVESLGGSVLGVARQLGAGFHVVETTSPFSYNVAGSLALTLATVSSVVVLGAAALVWWTLRAGDASRERTMLAVAATAVGFVAFAKVLSPQYLLFLVPIVPLVRCASAVVLFLGVLALTQIWARFPQPFAQVAALQELIWVTFVRNLLLVVLFGVLVRRLRPAAAG